MNRTLNLTLLILALFIFTVTSCKHKSKKFNPKTVVENEYTFDTSLQNDIIYPNITCKYDSGISYALYLPSNYSIKKTWPVIYCFDAHARGKLPLKLYSELAGKYGYILIGSNSSKNGLEWEANKALINSLMNDVMGRFAVNRERMYCMGFSGGARVACKTAIDIGKIEGVIGCAAGFPQLESSIETQFCYIGFSGDEDFNRIEMKSLDESLVNSGMPYYIEYFRGKHDWPNAEIMEDGILWLEFNAYKKFLVNRVDSNIIRFKVRIENELSSAEKAKNYLAQYQLLRKATIFLNSLTNVSEYTKKFEELNKLSEMQKLLKEQKEITEREKLKQQDYKNAMNPEKAEWLNKEISLLNSVSVNSKKKEEALQAKRLLSFISLMANMGVTTSLANKELDAVVFFLNIYGLADPKNPDYYYLSAYYFALKMDADKTLTFLKNAVKFGYSDKNKLMTDATFDFLKNNSTFNEIIKSINDYES